MNDVVLPDLFGFHVSIITFKLVFLLLIYTIQLSNLLTTIKSVSKFVYIFLVVLFLPQNLEWELSQKSKEVEVVQEQMRIVESRAQEEVEAMKASLQVCL